MKKQLFLFFVLSISFLLSSCKTGIMLENGKTLKINDDYFPWTIYLNNESIDVSIKEASDFSKYVKFSCLDNSLEVSIFIEPAYITNKTEEYRDASIETNKKLFKGITGIIKTNTEDYSQCEFFLPDVNGVSVDMYDIRRHIIKDGFWIDLHVSKYLYSEKMNDKKMMLQLLDSIKFIPKSKHKDMLLTKDYNERKFNYLVNSGISYYMLENYEGSKKYLWAANEMKQNDPALDNERFPFSLFILSSFYLDGENSNKALKILENGSGFYPNNPYLQYGLSIYYANNGDMDNTILALAKMSKNIDEWSNYITLKSPLENELYKKFWQNKEFIRAVREMNFKK